MLRTADPKAPMTNPSWTDIVSQACPDGPRFQVAPRAGTTAEAENQTDMPRNSARARQARARRLSPGARAALPPF